MPEAVDLFDSQFDALERSMDIAARRQEVISHNIANAKTPGYEPMEFNEELMQAVKRENKKQVVLEDELAALTDNSIKYSTYVKLLSSKISILKTIATQGRR
jgi:flagellar basal body rod protein FlgB